MCYPGQYPLISLIRPSNTNRIKNLLNYIKLPVTNRYTIQVIIILFLKQTVTNKNIPLMVLQTCYVRIFRQLYIYIHSLPFLTFVFGFHFSIDRGDDSLYGGLAKNGWQQREVQAVVQALIGAGVVWLCQLFGQGSEVLFTVINLYILSEDTQVK